MRKGLRALRMGLIVMSAAAYATASPPSAQTPPSAAEIAAYVGLHAAVARGDVAAVKAALAGGADKSARDSNGRTALHVAAHSGRTDFATALLDAGADANALDNQRYDIITIAAVRNDLPMLRLALAKGGNPKSITSPYDGTALIAAAHLGHHEVVTTLIAAGAPLDHINNIAMTALIESIVLGDGGPNHQACAAALLKAGADPNLAGRPGATPLALARGRGYSEMVRLIEAAGGR
jgi:uncharacterized protein